VPRSSSSILTRIQNAAKTTTICMIQLRHRTKHTIQMLTAYFGLIKLSFDYAIMFSIALGLVLVLKSCQLQYEFAVLLLNGTSAGSLMILVPCPRLGLLPKLLPKLKQTPFPPTDNNNINNDPFFKI